MAELFVCGSGSTGNAYLLQCNGETLIIECGLPFSAIAGPLDNDLSSVVGCVASHRHTDHYKHAVAEKLQDLGVEVVAGWDMTHKRRFALGHFSILPLKVPHGDCPNMAFVIDCADGRLVFATDLTDFPYHIKGCNFLCIEANYSSAMRICAEEAGAKVWSQSENHMEINTSLNVIKRHLSNELTDVVLIHLSDSLSDSDAFVSVVEDVCDESERPLINVYAAKAGEEYPLNEIPF